MSRRIRIRGRMSVKVKRTMRVTQTVRRTARFVELPPAGVRYLQDDDAWISDDASFSVIWDMVSESSPGTRLRMKQSAWDRLAPAAQERVEQLEQSTGVTIYLVEA